MTLKPPQPTMPAEVEVQARGLCPAGTRKACSEALAMYPTRSPQLAGKAMQPGDAHPGRSIPSKLLLKVDASEQARTKKPSSFPRNIQLLKGVKQETLHWGG